MIRLATEKSLQADIKSLKSNDDYAKSWQPLLIMYRSRHEKRLAWKEKSSDFEKIEQALVDQQKELEEIEEKLPKPLKIKSKKSKEKPRVARSKEAVVYVLDLENKTAEPFGNSTIDNDEEEQKEVEQPVEPDSKADSLPAPSSSSSATVISDPFFLNSQHHITYQKRTTRDKNEMDVDDKRFIEHSYFIDALSSSSNRRDGGGQLARQKWAHLTPPTRPSRPPPNRKFNGTTKEHPSKSQSTNDAPLHPSWEASKHAKEKYAIQKSQSKKIVFNHSDDENS